MKRLFLFISLITILALVGCTRSASTPEPDASRSDPTATIPFPDPLATVDPNAIPSDLRTQVSGGFATQTAMASEAGGQDSTSGDNNVPGIVFETPVPEAQPTEEPVAEAPTQAPAVQPTQAPAQQQPASTGCSSPYTVLNGEWVYSIGRKCNIHPDDIITTNRLFYPYLLYPGDKLILPTNARSFP